MKAAAPPRAGPARLSPAFADAAPFACIFRPGDLLQPDARVRCEPSGAGFQGMHVSSPNGSCSHFSRGTGGKGRRDGNAAADAATTPASLRLCKWRPSGGETSGTCVFPLAPVAHRIERCGGRALAGRARSVGRRKAHLFEPARKNAKRYGFEIPMDAAEAARALARAAHTPVTRLVHSPLTVFERSVHGSASAARFAVRGCRRSETLEARQSRGKE